MQEFTITRRPGFELRGEIKVQVDAPAAASSSVLLGLAVVAAIAGSADLRSADLRSANLYGADLRSANLYGADLRSADLRSANLYGADLRSADLRSANLSGANLSGADLSGADLRSADLRSANLYGADLRSANLYGADLRSADLRSANLSGAKNLEAVRGLSYQIPQEGALVVWKKLSGGHLAKLQIPAGAKRTATPIGRKCRASAAKVVAIFDAAGAKVERGVEVRSQHDAAFKYSVGAVVEPREPYNPSPWVECTSGIHFFLTREEAEAY